MTDLKDLIEREIDQYLEWPTDDRSHVTTVSAKLFAEHVARLYAEARKKVSRPQIREAFLRNGARIEPDRDDLPDYVYESVFELLEMAAPAVQGGPVAYLRKDQLRQVQRMGPMLGEIAVSPRVDRVPVYTAPQPAEQQPSPPTEKGVSHDNH